MPEMIFKRLCLLEVMRSDIGWSMNGLWRVNVGALNYWAASTQLQKMLEAGGTKSFHEDWCAIDFWLQLFNFWRGKLSASLLFHPLFLTLDLLNPCLTGAITASPIIDISSWETCLHRPHQTKLKNIWKHVGQFIAGKVESKNCWPGHTKHTLWRRLPQTLHTPTLRPNAGPAMAQVQIGRLRVPLQV